MPKKPVRPPTKTSLSAQEIDADPLRVEYSRRLKLARTKAGFAYAKDAAEALGMDPKHYYQIERGRNLPTWPTMHKLIITLGLDPAILFGAPGPDEIAANPPPDPRALAARAYLADLPAEERARLLADLGPD